MNEDSRRRSTRINLSIIVEFDDGKSVNGTFCRNISEKGFFLESVDHVEIGRLLKVTFRLPNRNSPICAQGIVRWRQSELSSDNVAGIGIEFVNLTAEEARDLQDELKHFLRVG
jgi:Tfp pilus assembly protein PilZ